VYLQLKNSLIARVISIDDHVKRHIYYIHCVGHGRAQLTGGLMGVSLFRKAAPMLA